MSTLKFARDLARFEEHLRWLRAGGGDIDAALAASYQALIAELVDLDERLQSTGLGEGAPDIADILARAVAVYREREAASSHAWEERHEAEYAEAARRNEQAVLRHELAMTAECPFCAAQPGAQCRTAGPTGVGHPKGIHDHKERYRAATDLEHAAG
jgi:hypothetical protein